MSYSTARVLETVDLNPRLRRVLLHIDDLAGLALPNCADEAVGIYLPAPDAHATLPMECRDGVWGYYDLQSPPEGRNYSVRAIDTATSTMTVDFVVHSRGPATLWAQRAEAGDVVVMSHARAWYRPESTTEWQLLVADLAGLPALARIIAELPDPSVATAVVEVADQSDLGYLPQRGGLNLIPLIGSGNGYKQSRIPEAVTEFTHPSGRGYCWFAAEATPSRAVRKLLRGQHQWEISQYDIIGYWRYDGEAWSKRYERHGEELLAVYMQALAEGKSEKAASEAFDEALERAGL